MTDFLASLPLRWLIYKQRRAIAPSAVLSIDVHRITGKTQRYVRPLDQRAFWPATAAQADAVQLIPAGREAEVRALLAGGAR